MDQFRGAYQQGLLAEGVDPNSFDPYGAAATGLQGSAAIDAADAGAGASRVSGDAPFYCHGIEYQATTGYQNKRLKNKYNTSAIP